jgi:hypothetical protein
MRSMNRLRCSSWMLETEYLAALRIDSRHHVSNHAVFPGSIHGLKNQQQGIFVTIPHCSKGRCERGRL